MFDKDHDGQISMSEVKDVVLQMGQTPNDKRIEELFKQVGLGRCWQAAGHSLLGSVDEERPVPVVGVVMWDAVLEGMTCGGLMG